VLLHRVFLKFRHPIVLQHRAYDLKVPCKLHKNCLFHVNPSLLFFDSKSLNTYRMSKLIVAISSVQFTAVLPTLPELVADCLLQSAILSQSHSEQAGSCLATDGTAHDNRAAAAQHLAYTIKSSLPNLDSRRSRSATNQGCRSAHY